MEKESANKEFFAFIQSKGFLWGPFPEIYGGFSGFYAYGPLGKLLKNKVEDSVRRVFQSHGLWELECPIILPDVVWKASGHLDTFTDRIITCSKCKAVFRPDKLIEEQQDVAADAFSDKKLLEFIKKHKITCPSCKGSFDKKISKHDLMVKTTVGGKPASLRPETATVTYLPFKRYYEFFRRKLPLGVFQIGKAFRNEVSPRQHVLRLREFTQAEGQIFIDPKKKDMWEKIDAAKKDKLPVWDHKAQDAKKKPTVMTLEQMLKKKLIKSKAYAWCLWLAYHQFVLIGVPADRIRLRQHHPDEKAFYADDAWDIEIKLNTFGWTEVCGVHDRTDYDLTKHAKFSKENLTADDEQGKKVVPHVLEIAFGIDRPTFALLDIFYEKKDIKEGKSMFTIPYRLAPIDVAIFPLLKKEGMPTKAMTIKQDLEKHFVVEYDESGSIGRRYLRAAEAGTPYCITIDHDTMKKDVVTIRDRDTQKQISIKVKELHDTLDKLNEGVVSFEKAGKLVK